MSEVNTSAVQKLRDGRALTPGDRIALLAVISAADELVAHIGAHGEINSRHCLTLDCLEALTVADPK